MASRIELHFFSLWRQPGVLEPPMGLPSLALVCGQPGVLEPPPGAASRERQRDREKERKTGGPLRPSPSGSKRLDCAAHISPHDPVPGTHDQLATTLLSLPLLPLCCLFRCYHSVVSFRCYHSLARDLIVRPMIVATTLLSPLLLQRMHQSLPQ